LTFEGEYQTGVGEMRRGPAGRRATDGSEGREECQFDRRGGRKRGRKESEEERTGEEELSDEGSLLRVTVDFGRR